RRTVLGKKVKALRREGVTPANIYGHKLESLAVQAPTPEVTHALRTSSRNAIFDLTVDGDGATRPAVVRDLQRDPVTGRVLHSDPDVVLARVATPRLAAAEEEGAAPSEEAAAEGAEGAEAAEGGEGAEAASEGASS